MVHLRSRIRDKNPAYPLNLKNIFHNDEGAIDLASIMVGIIVIGLIGGVIAATVFAVIPWSQDNAAKHQLESIHTAQNAYFGLVSDPSKPLAAGEQRNSFTNSAGLATANLLIQGGTYCTTPTNGGKDYQAYAKSSSGQVFTASNSNKKAVPVTGEITGECNALSPTNTGIGSGGTNPYVDPTPTKTIITYKCDTTTSGTAPFMDMIQGTLTLDGTDGSKIEKVYSNVKYTDNLSMKAGVTYTATFDGTYSSLYQGGSAIAACIRSFDHWGEQSGVKKAGGGLQGATKLTSVPEHIPSTVTDLSFFFYNAAILNDPNISKWDVSHVTTFEQSFYGAKAFNQSLNDWNMSNATNLFGMFLFTDNFNQPLDKWDTSNVTNMRMTFARALVFNQNINSWNVSKVTSMNEMFGTASKFNQPLDKWDVSAVKTMDSMFNNTTFNQDIGMWKPANVTDMDLMFSGNNVFNQNLSSWTFNVKPTYSSWAPTTPGYPTTYYPKFVP